MKDEHTYTVHFTEKNLSVFVEEGTTLLQAEIAAGLVPDALCGGQGKCGKCRVLLDGKEVLACQTKVEKDCTVSPLPGEIKKAQILNEGLFRKVPCQPGSLPPEVESPLLAAVDLGSYSGGLPYGWKKRRAFKYQKRSESSETVWGRRSDALQLCAGTRRKSIKQLYP